MDGSAWKYYFDLFYYFNLQQFHKIPSGSIYPWPLTTKIYDIYDASVYPGQSISREMHAKLNFR